MPYDDPDPSDPHVLVGVSLPAGPEAAREMAMAFAEEFAAMGFDEGRLMALFSRPFYAGAHGALLELGEDEVRRIVREALAVWGSLRRCVRDAQEGPCPR